MSPVTKQFLKITYVHMTFECFHFSFFTTGWCDLVLNTNPLACPAVGILYILPEFITLRFLILNGRLHLWIFFRTTPQRNSWWQPEQHSRTLPGLRSWKVNPSLQRVCAALNDLKMCVLSSLRPWCLPANTAYSTHPCQTHTLRGKTHTHKHSSGPS